MLPIRFWRGKCFAPVNTSSNILKVCHTYVPNSNVQTEIKHPILLWQKNGINRKEHLAFWADFVNIQSISLIKYVSKVEEPEN